MSKIGLFFGSFNPIHNGHLIMANYAVQHTDIDEILFVISPDIPFKECDKIASFGDRVEMVRLATNTNNTLLYSTIESAMPKPTYTINTLDKLTNSNPVDEYCLIIGFDNLCNIKDWKNVDKLLKKYEIYVCPRNNNREDFNQQVEILKEKYEIKKIVLIEGVPNIELSSTFMRNEILLNNNISYYTPNSVINYINKHMLYGN